MKPSRAEVVNARGTSDIYWQHRETNKIRLGSVQSTTQQINVGSLLCLG